MTQAAIYCRISKDEVGLALGVERQLQDCKGLAARLNWQVASVRIDNDTPSDGRPRPQHRRLLAEIEAGAIDALVVWDLDRYSRQPVEIEHLIELADRRGLSLASVGGDVDLATPQGRLTARIKASVAKHEQEQSSRRIRRKVLERAQAGKPHGKAAYGWRRVDGHDALVPHEAAIVREAAERIIAGESLRSVSSDLQRRGIKTPNGRDKWHPVMLRQVLLRERNAGLRRHQREIIGTGDWEPIFDADTLARVTAILRDPQRRTSPGGPPKHLLSGVAKCGYCGGPMRVMSPFGRNPAGYGCSQCYRVRRKQTAVDELVEKLVVARLSEPDALDLFTPPDASEEVAELEALKARLALAADQYVDGEIDGAMMSRISARLRPRIAELTAAVSAALAVPDIPDVIGPQVAERWSELPLDRKRQIIRTLVEVTILPAKAVGGRRTQFDPDSVRVVWRAAPSVAPAVPA